jgi:nucleoid-associated protein YgaU
MFVRTCIRTAALVVIALVFWSIVARPSGAHGPRTVYQVRAGDTLWSIAASHYGGDPRSAIWQIETANHLASDVISPGETLVLP